MDANHTDVDEVRFWTKVKSQRSSCWEWQGGGRGEGYGAMQWRGAVIDTHRISWQIHYGAIPDGRVVCHRCDNRICVRPDHLFLGTPADNVRDMVEKGRNNRGSKHGSAKLDEQKVAMIRHLAETGKPVRQISRKFGVHRNTIYRILSGENWAHA